VHAPCIPERRLVVIDGENPTAALGIEAVRVEAVSTADLEDVGLGSDRERVQDSTLEEHHALLCDPLPLHVDLVVEPLSRGL
jgi:hypothetical protein